MQYPHVASRSERHAGTRTRNDHLLGGNGPPLGKEHAGESGNTLDSLSVGRLVCSEESELQSRTIGTKLRHLLLRDRLHHEMDVDRDATRMRPQAVVDLLSIDKLTCDS